MDLSSPGAPGNPAPTVDPQPRRRARRTSLARAISTLGHPFVTSLITVGATAVQLGRSADALRLLALVGLFAVVPLALLMARQVRRGAWENVDASNVRDRPVLFLVAALALVALLVYTVAFRPDSFLLRGVGATLGMLAAAALATRWVKVSLHLAFAALAATALGLLGSPAGWGVAAAVPAIAWSRLELGRHRPGELGAGLILGVAAGLAIHFL